MAALPPTHVVADIKQYLSYLHADLRGNLLAQVRCSALAAKLRRLAEIAVDRVRRGHMQAGLLLPIRALCRDAVTLTSWLKTSNIIRLFVARDSVARKLCDLQLRISNSAARLGIGIRPFVAADDIRTRAEDLTRFNQFVATYRTDPAALQSLVRSIRPTELRDLHKYLASEVYSRPNRLVSATAFDFATKARRAIEQHFQHPLPARSMTSPHATGLGGMPPTHEIRRDLGTLPPIPANFGAAHVPVHRAHIGVAPATQPALQPLRSPLLGGFGRSPGIAPAHLTNSVPIRPLGSPHFGAQPGPSVFRSDQGIGALSPDPVIYEERHFTTTFSPTSPQAAPPATAIPRLDLDDPFGEGQSATSPRLNQGGLSPRAVPLPLSPGQTGVARLGPPPPVAPVTIRYYDEDLGQFLEWRPFHGWLWPTPTTIDEAKDYNDEVVKAQCIVTVVSQFIGLDSTQRQAILDHVSNPSRAPALLRQVAVGDKLRVLRIFAVRGVAWLACHPVAGGKPGFIPLKAVIIQGNPPAALPRQLHAPIHGSSRSFVATFRFLDSRGNWRTANCAGIVQPYRISYHEILPTPPVGANQAPVKWLHFPFSRVLSAVRVAAAEVVIGLRDNQRDRVVHLHFATAQEALHFAEDVDHMRRVTQRLIEIQEQRKREAALRAGGNAAAVPGMSQVPAQAVADAAVPGSTGLSPFLGSLGGAFDEGSLSPSLSQLGSPRVGPII